jgi:hypothetical protein
LALPHPKSRTPTSPESPAAAVAVRSYAAPDSPPVRWFSASCGQGMTPEELVRESPHLTLAQVYDALSTTTKKKSTRKCTPTRRLQPLTCRRETDGRHPAYLAEDVRPLLAAVLRDRGYDVLTSAEAGMIGRSPTRLFSLSPYRRQAVHPINLHPHPTTAQGAPRNRLCGSHSCAAGPAGRRQHTLPDGVFMRFPVRSHRPFPTWFHSRTCSPRLGFVG